MASLSHVRDFVKQIDETSWLIGGKRILCHVQGPYEGKCLWKNETDGSHYTLSNAPSTLPNVRPLPPNSHVRQIHDAGDSSAVFSIGDALILKVRVNNGGAPHEHKILAFLAKQQLSFDIPIVLFHAEEADKIYLFEPFMPGKRLNEAWWDMDKDEKEHFITRIASVCLELKAFRSNAMTGVDYNWMDPLREQRDNSPEALQKHCEELGMDCSIFVFSHNDLGPTNILINGDQIVVIDWEMAGYYPLAWVRTKFAICGALNVERKIANDVEIDKDYRLWVEQMLRDMEFPEVTEAYNKLYNARQEEWIKLRPWGNTTKLSGQIADALYCVAGGNHANNGFFVDIKAEDLDDCMKNNYYSAVYPAKSMLDIWTEDDKKAIMQSPRPKIRQIAFVSSAAAFLGLPGSIAYIPAKCAVRALADTLRMEVLRYSCPESTYTVHCSFPGDFVSPGFQLALKTKTELTKRMQGTNRTLSEIKSRYPSSDKVAALMIAAVARGEFIICDDSMAASLLFLNMIGPSPKRGWGIVDSLLLSGIRTGVEKWNGHYLKYLDPR